MGLDIDELDTLLMMVSQYGCIRRGDERHGCGGDDYVFAIAQVSSLRNNIDVFSHCRGNDVCIYICLVLALLFTPPLG